MLIKENAVLMVCFADNGLYVTKACGGQHIDSGCLRYSSPNSLETDPVI